jgi:glutamate-5-semialdehyde dehydrogenase
MKLDRLDAGTIIPFGGDRATTVPQALAEKFRPGDHLVILQDTGDLLHIQAAQKNLASEIISRAQNAFAAMQAISDDAITHFFECFAGNLQTDAAWEPISAANASDVERAQEAGRSTTRLIATARMRADMAEGLRAWASAPTMRGRILERHEHPGWTIEQVAAPLGVIGFVFEGRPNVFADAAGVLRSGNTAILRIGADALGTARAIMHHALAPALAEAGLPESAICLIDSPERAAGWALFTDRRLALAVARGSGRAVSQLGSIARQAGTSVSLHGTGGAWMIADHDADATRFAAVVETSLDRKVCNTLNTCCIHRDRAADLVPAFLAALTAAAGSKGCKLHMVTNEEELGHEWEWDEAPELTLHIIEDLDHAITLFNRHSPRFTASLISESPQTQARFYAAIEAPFVGDGFTRWVDGQYALNQPELGLSNWEGGRLLGRSAILSGNGVFTVRSRVSQGNFFVRR